MTNFKQLNFPSHKFDLQNIEWTSNQIGITTTADHPDDITIACGSMKYDWDKAYWSDKDSKQIVPLRDKVLTEQDFDTVASPFIGTLFEEVYNMLSLKYSIGRVRLMKMSPSMCLSWHTDTQLRLHYPIKTQEGCLMVIDDEVKHLAQDQWWLTNTLKKHTAFNGSREERIHLVVNVLGDYDDL
jgi:hypothetical protein